MRWLFLHHESWRVSFVWGFICEGFFFFFLLLFFRREKKLVPILCLRTGVAINIDELASLIYVRG